MEADLGQWLRFSDRNAPPCYPIRGETLTTHADFEHEEGEFQAANWRKEGWTITAVLVPSEQLEGAAGVLRANDLHIRPWWCREDAFDFGECLELEDICVYPWCFCYDHPVTGELRVEPRTDFLRYHALMAKATGEFHHPLDRILVMKVGQDEHAHYDPTPRVEVHGNYLRDYLAGCSSLPSGEICKELFQTRMQLNPPHSPGAVELIGGGLKELNEAFKTRYGAQLHSLERPGKRECMLLSVGPVTDNRSDLAELGKILFAWVVEKLSIKALKRAIGDRAEWDAKSRQIKLLEVLMVAEGLEQARAREMLSPLRGLNELRVGSAHLVGVEWDTAFQLMGADRGPSSCREAWRICVDSVAEALEQTAKLLPDGHQKRQDEH